MSNNGQKQVSLAGAAGNPSKKGKNKKKPFPWKMVFTLSFLALFALAVILLVWPEDEGEKLSLDAREMVTYTVTPDNIRDNVSYYLLGVTGTAPAERLDMAAVMCYDRQKDTVSVIQIPVNTYIKKETGYAVNTYGDVWGNPQSVPFCATHRVKLSADEIESGKHKGCGSAIEYRVGSSREDMIRVMNEQYGLPIDNYLLIPREGLVQLIDSLGGVDIKLDKNTTLSGTTYNAGVRTLSGQAAVNYAVEYNYSGSVAADRERMIRQRQVFAAVLQRIGRSQLSDLYAVDENTEATMGIIGRLMLGKYPILFNNTSFGKAQLLQISDAEAEKLKLSDALARFLHELGSIPLQQITFSILPGASATSGSATVYSVNKTQALELLNEQMNPYDLVLDDTTVKIPEVLLKQSNVDTVTATLDTYAQEQTGTVTTTTAASTTTTIAGMG